MDYSHVLEEDLIFLGRDIYYYSDPKACLRGNTEIGQDSEAGVNIQPILGGLRTVGRWASLIVGHQ